MRKYNLEKIALTKKINMLPKNNFGKDMLDLCGKLIKLNVKLLKKA